MAENVKDLRTRIRSVKNTAKLTRAMKMVSAAKLRRSQEAMFGARPYAHGLRRVLGEVAGRVGSDAHPLLETRDVKNVELIVISGDKGLCGSFNSNILKCAGEAIAQHHQSGRKTHLTLIGKKGAEFYKTRHDSLLESHSDIFRDLEYTFAEDVAERVRQRFIDGETDATYLVFNEFKSAIAQNLIVQPLLPFGGIGNGGVDEDVEAAAAGEYIFEPAAAELLNDLLPRYVAFQLFHAMLESIAAEHSARMAAMDAATRNAEDMIDTLTLRMNRARQAAITTEIIEVVSGAQALG